MCEIRLILQNGGLNAGRMLRSDGEPISEEREREGGAVIMF